MIILGNNEGDCVKYALVHGAKIHIRNAARGTIGNDCWFPEYEVKACKGHYMQYWKYSEDHPDLPEGYENETEWHAAWKQAVQDDFCEVVCGENREHRADIRTQEYVIELQYSSISYDAAIDRCRFYHELTNQRVVWVVNVYDAWKKKNLRVAKDENGQFKNLLVTWKYPKKWAVDICGLRTTTVLLDINPTAVSLLLVWKHDNRLFGRWISKESFYDKYINDAGTGKENFLAAMKGIEVNKFLK